jgi:hypothetical protein
VALALAADAEAARYAVAAGRLAGWWAWHGPRLALEVIGRLVVLVGQALRHGRIDP